VTGLLPHLLRQGVTAKSVSAASQSFGVVVFVLLVLLLLELEAIRVLRRGSGRILTISIVSAPLFVALLLTIAARTELILH
jgi:hypothetical protein